MAHPLPTVPVARGGPITENILLQIMASGQALQQNIQPTDEDLTLVLLCAPQIAEELYNRRKAMELIKDFADDTSNVRFLPVAKT